MLQHRINDQIAAKQVILIDEDGVKRGVVDIETAKRKAAECSLDLVQFGQGETPLVKLLKYEKYCYQQKKSEKDKKKAQKEKGVKEIVLGINIGPHDFKTKINKIAELLDDKYKVKVEVKLRGREQNFKSDAVELVRKACIEATGEEQHDVRISDGLIFAFVSPKKEHI